MLVVVAILGSVAGGVVVIQRLDRDRQYRQLLAQGEQALAAGNTYAAIEASAAPSPCGRTRWSPTTGAARRITPQHRDDEAIRDLREASRLAPDAPQPLVALGELYDAGTSRSTRRAGTARPRSVCSDEDPALLYALALARYRAGSPGGRDRAAAPGDRPQRLGGASALPARPGLSRHATDRRRDRRRSSTRSRSRRRSRRRAKSWRISIAIAGPAR